MSMQSFQMLLDAGVDPYTVEDLVQKHIQALHALPLIVQAKDDSISKAVEEAEDFIRKIYTNERMRVLAERCAAFQEKS